MRCTYIRLYRIEISFLLHRFVWKHIENYHQQQQKHTQDTNKRKSQTNKCMDVCERMKKANKKRRRKKHREKKQKNYQQPQPNRIVSTNTITCRILFGFVPTVLYI